MSLTRISIILFLFSIIPLTLRIIHGPTLIKNIGLSNFLNNVTYLNTYIRFSGAYQFIFDAHRYVSAVWFILGLLQLFRFWKRDIKFHKFLGYSYAVCASSSAILGMLMVIVYRPKIPGENIGYFYVSTSAIYVLWSVFNLIYYAMKRNRNKHRRWAIRSWASAVDAILVAVSITIMALLGFTVGRNTYITLLAIIGLFSLFMVEWICMKIYPNENILLDWVSF